MVEEDEEAEEEEEASFAAYSTVYVKYQAGRAGAEAARMPLAGGWRMIRIYQIPSMQRAISSCRRATGRSHPSYPSHQSHRSHQNHQNRSCWQPYCTAAQACWEAGGLQ